ncbi:MAG: response regulator [Bdellovibrionales bacterium]|nr:response regulator [Bdellovibrionales bacterium]
MDKVKIVVAEDELDIRELIHFNLFKENYEVKLAGNGNEALQLIRETKPDLALLDIMMPGKDGVEVCRQVRSDDLLGKTRIIMLTAKGTEADIVRGLESGADDYITKPFSPKILSARVKAVLRRQDGDKEQEKDQLSGHGIELYPAMRRALCEGQEVDLTYTEFTLLQLLMSRPGVVYTRSQIVDRVRGENHAITDRSVDVQVVGLRRKLGEKGSLVETVRGVGYRFKQA